MVARVINLRGKPHYTRQGEGKYLLDRHDQWEKLAEFLTQKRLYFPRGHEFQGHYAESQPFGKDTCVYQKFITTPSDYYTSYRVVVSALGQIICSSLFYSESEKSDREILKIDSNDWGVRTGNLFNLLLLPKSPVFLGARKIVSNRSQGGGGIVLNPGPNSKTASKEEKRILRAHSLNPDKPELPKDIAQKSQLIAKTLGRRKSLILGIDWIQDCNGRRYFLEMNAHPGMQSYIDHKMNGYGEELNAYREVYSKIITSIGRTDSLRE